MSFVHAGVESTSHVRIFLPCHLQPFRKGFRCIEMHCSSSFHLTLPSFSPSDFSFSCALHMWIFTSSRRMRPKSSPRKVNCIHTVAKLLDEETGTGLITSRSLWGLDLSLKSWRSVPMECCRLRFKRRTHWE